MTDNYDLVAIGAGPAGESATELAAFGHRSAVIEKALPGGTVTTTGGAPTKTLREAALYLTGFRESDVYGLKMAAPPEIATDIVRKRTQDVCELLQKVTADNIASREVDYIRGTAKLDPEGGVIVSGGDGPSRRIRAKTILIASGSRPSRPENIPFDIPGVCDTDTILHLGHVPKDILIAGGGPVGVEFATICHALGATVTLVDRGTRLMSTMDGEASEYMAELFRNWDIKVQFGASVERVEKRDAGLEVQLSTGQTFFPETLLFAAGRIANTEGLGLEALGVQCDSRGRTS